jgi:hypothetical protein
VKKSQRRRAAHISIAEVDEDLLRAYQYWDNAKLDKAFRLCAILAKGNNDTAPADAKD